ncbi:MAG: hypothetical protein U1D06_13985 [Paracoccaceae bacterium]|nr:hypothetical protein [Paracoccaceae bacterium]
MSVLTVAACAVTPQPPPSDAALRKASNVELCQTYARAKSPYAPAWQAAARNELIRRGAVTKQDQADWSKGLVRIGMAEHIAVCSWGPYVDVNSTTGSWGTHRQYVIGQFGPYVYTENGVVTSFQN